MTRLVVLTHRFRRAFDRLAPEGERRRAVARTIATLASAGTLPGPSDTEAMIPPTSRAFVRRVQGRNLWLWFTATAERLVCIGLTAEPPTPLD